MLKSYGMIAMAMICFSFSGAEANAADLILYHMNEMPLVDVNRMHIEGHSGERTVSAGILRNQDDKGVYSYQVTLNDGDKDYIIDINDEFSYDLKNVDIQSFRFFANQNADSKIILEARIGDARDCYANDDGRDRLTVVLEGGMISAHIISYDSCKIEIIYLGSG